jgi:hypothetical protein
MLPIRRCPSSVSMYDRGERIRRRPPVAGGIRANHAASSPATHRRWFARVKRPGWGGLIAAPQNSSTSAVRDQANLAAHTVRLGEPAITGDEGTPESLGRRDIGGVVGGNAATQLPHPANQTSYVDLVNDECRQRIYCFLCPDRPELAANSPAPDHRHDLDEQVSGCRPMRVVGQRSSSRIAHRAIIDQRVGEDRCVYDDHATSPSPPRCARCSASSAEVSPGSDRDPSDLPAKRSSTAVLRRRRACISTNSSRYACNDCPRALAWTASASRTSSGTSRIWRATMHALYMHNRDFIQSSGAGAVRIKDHCGAGGTRTRDRGIMSPLL